MSCDAALLESLVYGELEPGEAASRRAHLAHCPRCREELQWLRVEHQLVHGRPLRAVPQIVRRRVEARWPGPRQHDGRWLAPLAVAAAFVLAVVLSIHPRSSSTPVSCARPDLQQSSVTQEEAGFGACLVATPADSTYATSSL
jgi:anti-sigma factor RsiW